jgi:hypothetical protein
MDFKRLNRLAAQFAREGETSAELKAHAAQHQRRRLRAQKMLTLKRIPNLREAALRELFFDSDAFNYWTNKDWEFQRRVASVGLSGLRTALCELVEQGEQGLGAEELGRLWARRGLGKVLCAELLAYRFPARYWTWSKVVVPALKYFGAALQQNTKRKQTPQQEAAAYFGLQESVEQVRRALADAGVSDADYLTVDLFLWWVQQPRVSSEERVADFDVPTLVPHAFQAQGFYYTPWQIATFWTALQTKGFVILSGISGTGKTKLAQTFSTLFPQPGTNVSAGPLAVPIEPSMLKTGRIPLLQSTLQGSAAHLLHSAQEVVVSFDGQSQNVRVTQAHGESHLLLHGKARQWLQRAVEVGQHLVLEPEIDADRDVVHVRLFAQNPAPAARPSLPVADSTTAFSRNLLFLPVRPDWHDSKALLGYYNPLTSHYEWTPFLQWIRAAADSFRARDGLLWFVLFDEMNLARVEHYFADLLSVLESGRDVAGWTREPLRFVYPPEAEGELPPRELYLPPNLYFIGTVNIDETTHLFSPKVLDRAWTLPLDQVDFSHYPPASATDLEAVAELGAEEKLALQRAFVRPPLDNVAAKNTVAKYLEAHGEVRLRLHVLNEALKPYGLGFGYRTFDEIVLFLEAAQHNKFFSPHEAAFDAAVLAKIAIKFHGSATRLEAPLRMLLAWCLNPDAPAYEAIDRAMKQTMLDGEVVTVLSRLAALDYALPQTAATAQALWRSLQNEGFAAFGAG